MSCVHRKSDGQIDYLEEYSPNTKEIFTTDLLALCELGEEYKSFCHDLERLIQVPTPQHIIEDIYNVINGKNSIYAYRYHFFIKKYKHAIEVMDKYSCTKGLTIYSYDENGNRKPGCRVDYFCQILEENKDNLEVIRSVALRLQSLGFKTIHFNKDLDFSNYIYSYSPNRISAYIEFCYTENMEIFPRYLSDPIIYSTTGSNYCIYLIQSGLLNREIEESECKIFLNNLVFDPNVLPEKISPETTADVIIGLTEAKSDEYTAIRQSVDFGITLKDLTEQYQRLSSITKEIDPAKNYSELSSLMAQMNEILKQIQDKEKKYESSVTTSHPAITPELIEEEKKLYLRRRADYYIDAD